jgi:hypothetical protein
MHPQSTAAGAVMASHALVSCEVIEGSKNGSDSTWPPKPASSAHAPKHSPGRRGSPVPRVCGQQLPGFVRLFVAGG